MTGGRAWGDDPRPGRSLFRDLVSHAAPPGEFRFSAHVELLLARDPLILASWRLLSTHLGQDSPLPARTWI